METIFDTKISCYSNVTDTTGKEITLRDFLFCDQYKVQIEQLRAMANEEERKRLKRQLPLATISGTFAPTRRAENLVAHSHLLCIDIDKKDNLDVPWFDSLHNEWHNVPQILYAAHSVGGEGWFAIFRIAYPEKHREQFEALRRDFAREGLTIDRSCSDVSRMRIISYDPEPYVNEQATLYNKVWVEPKPKARMPFRYDNSGGDLTNVEKCCQTVARSGIDITTTYDDWFHVGAALASLGERGRSLFHMVSAQNGQYKPEETDRKFDNFLRNVNNISIGSFFHICDKYGISWREELPRHKRNTECQQCHRSHEGINGTYCNKLSRYVEYGKGNCEAETTPGVSQESALPMGITE